MAPKIPLNVIFLGTDEFSIPILRKLIGCVQRVRVVSAGGKRQSRRGEIPLPPAAMEANANGLEYIKLQDGWKNFHMRPDDQLAITASFGRFVPFKILNQLPYGGINIHPSLLPKYRGAGPVYSTILNGDRLAGVTIQTMDSKQFDKGKSLAQAYLKLNGKETYTLLTKILSLGAAGMLEHVLLQSLYLPNCQTNTVAPQIHGRITDTGGLQLISKETFPSFQESWAKKITPEDAHVNFESMNTQQIYNMSRAFNHVWCILNNKKVFLYDVHPLHSTSAEDWIHMKPGEFALLEKNLLLVKTLDHVMVIKGGIRLSARKIVDPVEWGKTFNSGRGGRFQYV
ncbi:putative methionyl-tRNA formyltransferase [Schizosaccharomyces pombe]|uniref:Putative methionyl-tRNA formyltransferase n=1 Tax=Schizosaccharomyces pombe (strain 972 / ATCC 24843) TaxID=284812 RepID=FMT_SCHPO|nr:putative methionyl-tRNA formyltransferase Fmt1 [Schizosaccharomyces pombe]Q9UTG6.1 RecName: Full=Putative methionyl-tRNA formyltransferase [Schizosaccharomyces pombe 972h-]CAB55850.1 methionyl-tRNA formyltransferase Fmt1 (predicted) [Schizosaccharomyces pombe]|eukprot:NP_593920.1 putative methionyl-tRNA formyltransferase Fmt1 [Schizosaccharomyces pombe]